MSPEDDPSPAPRDDVATLLRLAGRRPAVPPEAAARVRAATHEHWRGELRRRARARRLWTAAALATAAAAILALALGVGWTPRVRRGPPIEAARPPLPREIIRVESLAGPAWVRDGTEPGDRLLPLSAGAEVPLGAQVETGEGGRLALRLPSGHSLRLDSASRIEIVGRTALALARGAVYLDSGLDSGPGSRPGSEAPARPAAPLAVRTPLGEVQEAGTQFEVRLGLGTESVRIRVREGAVVLRAAGRAHTVGALTELEADGRGGARRRRIARYGPEWGWIAGIAPMPDLEGLSARAFLDAMAREGGWSLGFADEETARLAAGTVLRGSVEGLTVEQALDAVLPTCGMVHRVDGGRLIVARSAA